MAIDALNLNLLYEICGITQLHMFGVAKIQLLSSFESNMLTFRCVEAWRGVLQTDIC